jgi:hypothetical protein
MGVTFIPFFINEIFDRCPIYFLRGLCKNCTALLSKRTIHAGKEEPAAVLSLNIVLQASKLKQKDLN